MVFIPYFREKVSRIVKNCHGFPFIRTVFVFTLGVFLTNSSSISEYILVNRNGTLGIYVRFKPNAANPAEQS